MAKQGIQQIRLNAKPGPLSITHLSLCVYISIRIGHGQQENIHFLQDGGDGWVLPIIRCNLSRDKLVSDARAGWGARSKPVSSPEAPLRPPCRPHRHGPLQSSWSASKPGGTWLQDDINICNESRAAWFIHSFLGGRGGQ